MTETLQTIVQDRLLVEPWTKPSTKRLPGVNLLDWKDWLLVDEAFSQQMAYRDQLLAEKRESVFAANPLADAASAELLDMVLDHLKIKKGYSVEKKQVIRPDDTAVGLESDHPLVVAGRLVQQDFCLMQRGATEHILRAAVLCFPSNWRLSEKIDHPMSAIHSPVDVYDSQLAARVQRIMDNIGPKNPVWRANYLLYATANLFQPNREKRADRETGKWVRVERQSLVFLPKTDFLCFGIHTHIVPISTLSERTKTEFLAAWENHKHYYGVSGSA